MPFISLPLERGAEKPEWVYINVDAIEQFSGTYKASTLILRSKAVLKVRMGAGLIVKRIAAAEQGVLAAAAEPVPTPSGESDC